jgi:hypothetical protein
MFKEFTQTSKLIFLAAEHILERLKSASDNINFDKPVTSAVPTNRILSQMPTLSVLKAENSNFTFYATKITL